MALLSKLSLRTPLPSRRRRGALACTAVVATALGLLGMSHVAVASALSVYYVSAGGANTGACTAVASPCATVSYALTQARSGGTIEVAGTIQDNIDVTGAADITITGAHAPAGSPAVLDGNHAGTVVEDSSQGNLTLDHVQIVNGSSSGIFTHRVTGTLTITHSTIRDNTGVAGGGITVNTMAPSVVRVTDSTIANNEHQNTQTFNDNGGGGIDQQQQTTALPGKLIVDNSTITGNRSPFNGGGGAIEANGGYPDSVELIDSTITGNSANYAGGLDGVGYLLAGTILADNTSNYATLGNCNSTGIDDAGYNLDSDGTCALRASTDLAAASPHLGLLSDNGGPTQTMEPVAPSPVLAVVPSGISVAGVSLCPRVDQRGAPSSGACSIGAVDGGAATPPVFTSPDHASVPATRSFSVAVTTAGGLSGGATSLRVAGSTPLPAGVGFTDNGDGTGAVIGTLAQPGTYSITLQASDGVGPDASQNLTLSATAPALTRPLGPRNLLSTIGTGLGAASSVAVGPDGAVYVADTAHNEVVRFATNGVRTTIGSGLSAPIAVSVDAQGAVYVLEQGHSSIDRIAPDGHQSTIGHGLVGATALAVDTTGDIYVAVLGSSQNDITAISPSGLQSEIALLPNVAHAVVVDPAGQIYVAITNNNEVLRIATDGTETAFGPSFSSPNGVAIDRSGNVYVISAGGQTITQLAADGTSTGVGATVAGASGIAVGASGQIFTLQPSSGNLVEVQRTPTATALGHDNAVALTWSPPISDDGSAITSYLVTAHDATTAANGGQTCSYLVTTGNTDTCTISGLVGSDQYTFTVTATNGNGTGDSSTPSNTITPGVAPSPPLGRYVTHTTLASGSVFFAVTVDQAGHVYAADHNGNRIVEYASSGTVLRTIAVNQPMAVAVDGAGNIYTISQNGSTVTEITPAGTQSARGHGFTNPTGLAADPAGYVYVTDDGNSSLSKIAPDGTQTQLHTFAGFPLGVAVDAVGNAYVAVPSSHEIDRVEPDGTTAPYGPSFGAPRGVAFDGAGNLYVGDSSTYQVYVVPPGGAANPLGPAFANAGDLYIATAPDGTVYVSAGGGSQAIYAIDRAPSATATDPTSATVSWLPPAFPGSGTITGYTVHASDSTIAANGGQTCSYAVTTPPANTCTVTGLTTGDRYTFTVTATGPGGTSHPSQPSNAVQQHLVAPARPSPPLGHHTTQTPFASGSGWDVAVDAQGDVYGASLQNNQVLEYSPAGTVLRSIGVYAPAAVAVDDAGNVYTSPLLAGYVLKIAPDGTQTQFGGYPEVDGLAVDHSGNVYVADAADGVSELAPDGTRSTVSASTAGIVAVDDSGNVYVPDPSGSHVVKIAANGTTTTLSPTFGSILAIAADASGAVYVSDHSFGSISGVVSRISPDGTTTPIGTSTGLAVGLAVGPLGNVYVGSGSVNSITSITQAPQASAIDSTSASVSWLPPAFPGTAPVTGYAVTATDTTTAANGGQACAYTVAVPEHGSCTMAGLTTGDSYTFTVVATNAIGTSDPSAPSNAVTLSPGPTPQSISFTSTVPADAVVGGPSYTVTATGGGSLNPVTFALDPSSSGCSIADTAVTFVSVGTCVIDANQAGGGSYAAATQQQQRFNVAKGAQSALTVTSVSGTFGSPVALTTVGGTGTGAVSFTMTDGTASGCTVTGSSLTATGAGSCIVTATKAGDGNYTSVSSDPTAVTFDKAPQAIRFTAAPPSHAVVGGPAYTVTATGGESGNPVTFTLAAVSTGCSLSGSTLSFVSVGTCVIDANQAGDADYLDAAQVQERFAIGQGSIAPTPNPVTVSFNARGGTPSPAGQTIPAGTTATAPAPPSLTNSTFEGWYTAADTGSLWDFATGKVNSDLTLYAHWTGVSLTATSVAQGGKVTVTGRGFAPGENVRVVMHSRPLGVGTFAATSTGTVRFTLAVPADFPTGAHSVVVTGESSGRTARAKLTVTTASATAAGNAQPLASTGTDIAALMGWALPVLLVGLLCLILGGRRRAT